MLLKFCNCIDQRDFQLYKKKTHQKKIILTVDRFSTHDNLSNISISPESSNEVERFWFRDRAFASYIFARVHTVVSGDEEYSKIAKKKRNTKEVVETRNIMLKLS